MRASLSAFLLAVLPLAGQAPCDCIDKGDLRERINRVTAAIQAYGKEIITTGMASYSPAARVALQNRVDQAMGAAATPGRIRLGACGGTTNNCDIVVTAPTKCLEGAIRAHEKVHQDACRRDYDETASKILTGKAKDRFDALKTTMSFYMMEELEGYQAELMYLNRELARLTRDCQTPSPAPRRDYSSSRTNAPSEAGGLPTASGPAAVGKPKPITAPPLNKPKPFQPPPPIK